MKQETTQVKRLIATIKVVALALLLSVGASYILAAAPPNPPACPAEHPGCDAPIHTGVTTQIKKGNFFSNDTIFSITGLFTKLGVNNVEPVAQLDVVGDIHATEDICTDAGGGVCLGSSAATPAMQFMQVPVSYDLNPTGSEVALTLGSEVPAGTAAVLVSVSVSSDARVYFYTMDSVFTGGVGGRTGAGETVSSAGGQLILPIDSSKRLKYKLTGGDSDIIILASVDASSRSPITATCSPNKTTAPDTDANTTSDNVTWTANVSNAPAGTTYAWKSTGMTGSVSSGTLGSYTKTFSGTGVKVMNMYVTAGTANLTVTCSPNVTITAN
ncbi:MAG: hypothetical protein V4526_00460 [Patescibacteria group bacterium]